LIAKWLNAKHYISNYKPIPIEEFLVFGNAIYPASASNTLLAQLGRKKSIQSSALAPCRLIREPLSNAVVALALETAMAGYGALIFCRSRQRCQKTALLVGRTMPSVVADDVLDKRKEIISELRNLSIAIDEDLAQAVMKGVAFHRMWPTTPLMQRLTSPRCGNDERGKKHRG